MLVSTPLVNKTTRIIYGTIQTIADTSIEKSSVNARQRSSRKRRSESKATEIREKKRSSENNDHEYVLLSEALTEVAELSIEEDAEIIIFPPVNTDDGDTDTETGKDQEFATAGYESSS